MVEAIRVRFLALSSWQQIQGTEEEVLSKYTRVELSHELTILYPATFLPLTIC